MKFTKEELSNAVKAKLTANGKSLSMSDKTLNDMVSNHYQFAGEETELDEFVTKVLPSYETVEGNLRKDNADFVKQWEKEHPQEEGGRKPGKKTASSEDELLARIEVLEKERSEEKSKRAISGKRDEIKKKAKEKGISNAEWLDSYLAGLAVTEDADVEKMADNALKLFNISNAEVETNVIPGRAGGGGEQTKDLFADIAAKRKPQE